MTDATTVLGSALKLDPESRAALAQELLSSLDNLAPEEFESLWVEEASRRRQDIIIGASAPIAAKTVHARAEALLRG